MPSLNQHEQWMHEALQAADRGCYGASPNPLVGACIVRNDRCVGMGWHEHYGGDHAEIRALKKAGSHAAGSTLYVTLEPCSSWGKTPPCVNAIRQAGVRHVVVGALDPNPMNHRKGVGALRRAGIRVTVGVLAQKVRAQNESFFKYVLTGLPFVTLKMAQSLDGKIATCKGQSRWISSPEARHYVHYLRARHDAVLVGKNTLFCDDPRLMAPARIPGKPVEKPWRVVLDPELKISARARVFGGRPLTLVAVAERILNKSKRRRIAGMFLPTKEKKGKLDVADLMKSLASLGIARLLVEGGGELAWSLLHERLVDKILWIVAPKIIGGRDAKTSVEGEGVPYLDRAFKIKVSRCTPLGSDWLFEGTPLYSP